MPDIEVGEGTYRELELLAVAWHTTIPDVVRRLVHAAATGVPPRRAYAALVSVAVHASYAGTRIEAIFEPEPHAVTVRSGPLRGRIFKTPSGARRAVIEALNPGASSAGNGWHFWTVTATGARLHTLR
ncbi:hypothetical protein GCM10009682_35690 [Luedemannella flava]|uniref:Uncharacterized protein n=1 Tax=Luedemannella flava TaxID=349316 RepID=A0ABP4YEK0_9ACTN